MGAAESGLFSFSPFSPLLSINLHTLRELTARKFSWAPVHPPNQLPGVYSRDRIALMSRGYGGGGNTAPGRLSAAFL